MAFADPNDPTVQWLMNNYVANGYDVDWASLGYDGPPQQQSAPAPSPASSGWGTPTGYDELGSYVGTQPSEPQPWQPSSWSTNLGLQDIETKIANNVPLSLQEMNLLQGQGIQAGSSIAPQGWVPDQAAGNQSAIWSGSPQSFVNVIQDTQSGNDSLRNLGSALATMGLSGFGGAGGMTGSSMLNSGLGITDQSMSEAAQQGVTADLAGLGAGSAAAGLMAPNAAMDIGGGLGLDSFGNVSGGAMGLSGSGTAGAGATTAPGSLQGAVASGEPDFANIDWNQALGSWDLPNPQTDLIPQNLETGGFNPASDPNLNFNVGTANPNITGFDPVSGTAYETGNAANVGGGLGNTTAAAGGTTVGNALQTAGQAIGGAAGAQQILGGGQQIPGGTGGGNGGINIPGMIGAGIDYLGNQQYRSQLLDLMQQGLNRVDPFYSQRPQYQNLYQQYNTDPNFLNNDAVLQSMQNAGTRAVQNSDAARGFNMSGNIMHDIARTATETAAPYAIQRGQQLGIAAGAYSNPGAAASVVNSLGGQAAQATQQGYGSLGAMAQYGMGQNGQGLGNLVSGIGSGINNLYDRMVA